MNEILTGDADKDGDCLWRTGWLCGDCKGDEKCPNYIKPEVEVTIDKQLTLFEI